METERPRLRSRDFILIIVINFLIFLNHLSILSTFPFYIEHLGGSESVAGFAAAAFSIVAAILVYFFWASRHPSSFSYRLKHQNEQH